MNASPLFSVIIPTYSRPRFLDEAVGSVLSQTVDDLECLVVDDASPEPVHVAGDARLRIIRRGENAGPAAARNTGIAEARGRYIAFLDDDDWYTPDRLAMALEGLRRAPVTVCWSRYHDTPGRPQRLLNGDVSDHILDATTPHLGATTVERSAVVLFDERFVATQDVEWWLRLAQSAGVATVPRHGCVIRRHTQVRHNNTLDTRIRCSLLLFQTHADYFARHPQAEAFRWKRIGVTAMALGYRRKARQAFIRALRLRPDPGTLGHLLRSWLPRRLVGGAVPTIVEMP